MHLSGVLLLLVFCFTPGYLHETERCEQNIDLCPEYFVPYDVCIIGAGMFGSAAAKHASTHSTKRICLIGPDEPTPSEREHRDVFSSYYDSSRITQRADDEAIRVALANAAIKEYSNIEKRSGMKFYYPVGSLTIAPTNSSDYNDMLKIQEHMNVSLKVLTREEFIERYPLIHLDEDYTGILEDNGAGTIDPRKMVAAQKRLARRQGCNIIKKIVQRVTLENDIYKITTECGRTIKSKKLIITTGAFVNFKKIEVLKPLNITNFKETVTLFQITEEEAKKYSNIPTIIYDKDNDPYGLDYMTPMKYPDGKYYLKALLETYDQEELTLEDLKEWFLSNGNQNIIDNATRVLEELLPELEYSNVKGLPCVYCNTPTTLPYIDNITSTLTVAVGGNGRSAKFSDEIGRMAAQLSVTGKWHSQLDKSRFKAIFAE